MKRSEADQLLSQFGDRRKVWSIKLDPEWIVVERVSWDADADKPHLHNGVWRTYLDHIEYEEEQ